MAAAGIAMLLADVWFFQKYFFQIRRFRIGDTGSGKKIKMVLLTDLHFKHHVWPFHKRLAQKINKLQPDVILCCGDLIDQDGQPEPARQFLSMLPTTVPSFFIPGNHDVNNAVSRQHLRQMVEEHNGRLLVNDTAQIVIKGIVLTITGLDDFIESESCLADAVKNTGREPHHLMLVHSPLQQEGVRKELRRLNAQRPENQRLNVQYIFAGHTHGGQVRWGSLIPILPEKSGGYVNGWYNQEKPYLYVSNGFGTSHIPFRFGARPEVTLFEYGVSE